MKIRKWKKLELEAAEREALRIKSVKYRIRLLESGPQRAHGFLQGGRPGSGRRA